MLVNPRISQLFRNFVDAVRGDYGNGDYKDIMAAVDFITENTTGRIPITGAYFAPTAALTNWIADIRTALKRL